MGEPTSRCGHAWRVSSPRVRRGVRGAGRASGRMSRGIWITRMIGAGIGAGAPGVQSGDCWPARREAEAASVGVFREAAETRLVQPGGDGAGSRQWRRLRLGRAWEAAGAAGGEASLAGVGHVDGRDENALDVDARWFRGRVCRHS